MAKSTSSAAVAANNLYIPSNHRSEPPRIVDGLVQHFLLSASTQVLILAAVDETGSTSVGDVIAALPGHPDPAGAVMALVSAGILDVEIRGVIDANTVLRRAPSSYIGSDPEPTAELQVQSPAKPGDGDVPEGLRLVPASALSPIVVVGSGDDRRLFAQTPALRRPGIYGLLSERSVYVGMGSDVGNRVATGQQPIEAVDTVFAVVDDNDSLTVEDARVLERMLWSRVAAHSERVLVNGVPDGGPVDLQRYSELDAFVAAACLQVRHHGVLFREGPARDVLAGPPAEPERVGPPRSLQEVPSGELVELTFGNGLVALAVQQADDRFVLLQGSDVRAEAVASSSASARYLRSAWLHAGLLTPSHDGKNLVVTRDLVFSSLSAVSQFVTGAKGKKIDAWQPFDGGDGDGLDAPLVR